MFYEGVVPYNETSARGRCVPRVMFGPSQENQLCPCPLSKHTIGFRVVSCFHFWFNFFVHLFISLMALPFKT